MNGANTEPFATTNKAPINTIRKIMGANQSFLRIRKKAHSSFMKSIV